MERIVPINALVGPDKYALKCPNVIVPDMIVVHNTANNAPAENEIAYMKRRPDPTSFHLAVDHQKIVQGLPLNRNGHHASATSGNESSIGLEICYSINDADIDKFMAAERLACKWIAQYMIEHNWDIGQIRKHQDFYPKYCPHRTLTLGWIRFLNMISAEIIAQTYVPTPVPVAPVPVIPIPVAPIVMRHNVGELVTFGSCYKSSTSKVGFPPNGEAVVPSVGMGRGTITKVYPGTNNPYLINNGQCFVNDGDIRPAGSNPTRPATTPAPQPAQAPPIQIRLGVGSIVRVRVGSKTYKGGSVAAFVFTKKYRIDELKGDRAVLDVKGLCTAFRISDLIPG